MYYVYMLYSKQYDQFYLGFTHDLKQRYQAHLDGMNKSTCKAKDWILAYYEAYLTEYGAKQREANLKRSGKAYTSLKQRIKHSIDNLGEGEALDRSPSKRRPCGRSKDGGSTSNKRAPRTTSYLFKDDDWLKRERKKPSRFDKFSLPLSK